MRDQPNVVLIISDDLGSTDVGCYGASDLVTPNLDRLAAEGVRFTQFYVNAAVCMASRVSLFTGRYFPRGLLPGRGLKPEEVTLAERFRQAGYRTGLFGKWHLGETAEMSPNAQGFEEFLGHTSGTIDCYSHFSYNIPVHRNVLMRNGATHFAEGTYLPDLLTEAAQAFVSKNRNQPFFLVLSSSLPHYPLQPKLEHLELYEGMEDKRRRLYGACATTLDESIGRVVDTIAHLGLTEDTVILFLSDNGHSVEEASFGGGGSSGPYRGHKGNLFEGGIRVPCLISWPGTLPTNSVRNQPCMAMDLAPTLAKWCGLSTSQPEMDGMDLTPILSSDGSPSPHQRLHWVHYNGSLAVREGRWKLHMTPEETMLIDILGDPGERVNRFQENREMANKLLHDHNAWIKGITGITIDLAMDDVLRYQVGAD